MVSNDVYDSVVLAINEISYYIKVTDFGFSLPAGATVTGVKVEIEGHRSATGGSPLWRVQLVKGGTIQGNQLTASIPTALNTYTTFGGDGQMWGLTLADTDIEASNFGCVVHAYAQPSMGDIPTLTYYADHIRITVYYTSIPARSLAGVQPAFGGVLARTYKAKRSTAGAQPTAAGALSRLQQFLRTLAGAQPSPSAVLTTTMVTAERTLAGIQAAATGVLSHALLSKRSLAGAQPSPSASITRKYSAKRSMAGAQLAATGALSRIKTTIVLFVQAIRAFARVTRPPSSGSGKEQL